MADAERLSGRRRAPWRLAALVILLAVAVRWQYGPTLSYGFVYDDYHFVRPYDRAELAAVFHGSWDTAGIERPFYRPLTIAFYAARFELFRFDARACHAFGLGLFTLAGAIGAWFVSRVSRSMLAAALFAAFWVVHPNLSISLVAWLTNQMHLLQAIVCLSALVLWWEIKARRAIWWTPLMLLQIAAFLVKEDGALLLPAILAIHLLYRATVDRTLRWPPIAAVAATVAILAALLALRQQALGGFGGYDTRLTRELMWTNLARGLERAVLLRPALVPLLQWQAWFVAIVLPLGALAAWHLRQASTAREGEQHPANTGARLLFLILCGLLIAIAFNLPFALVSKAEQYYMLATGCVIALAAASDALLRASRAWLRPIVLVAIVSALAAMQHTSRGLAATYSPASDETRRTDAIVTEWIAVAPEIRAWLPLKLQPPNTGDLARDLPCVSHGLYIPEQDARRRTFRWTTRRAQLFVRADSPGVRFVLEPLLIAHAPAAFIVRVLVEGSLVSQQTLAAGASRAFSVPLVRSDAASSRMRRVDIVLDRTWTPGGNDPRHLGVKVYELSCNAAVAPGARID